MGVLVEEDYNSEFGPLPTGFRKLQYLATNEGNPYLDLGIKLKKDYRVEILMRVYDYTSQGTRALFGARNSDNTNFYYDGNTDGAYAGYVRYAGYSTIGFQRGANRAFTRSYVGMYGSPNWYVSDGKKFEVRSIDGTVLREESISEEQNVDTEWGCYLFTVNDMGTPYAYGAQGHMYRCEIWDGDGEILMRLIPAKNLSTGSCGMYDLISGEFLYNRRSMSSFRGAEFHVWQGQMQTSDPDVSVRMESECTNALLDITVPFEYEKLYGVYFRECRVDTGYKVKSGDTVVACVTLENGVNTNSYKCVFGSRSSETSKDSFTFHMRYGGEDMYAYGRNGVVQVGSRIAYGVPLRIELSPNKAELYRYESEDSKVDVVSIEGTGVDSSNDLWLGCCDQNGTVKDWGYATFHWFRIVDEDGGLVLEYVPVKRLSDGVVGFYDTVSGGFVTRASGNYSLTGKTGGNQTRCDLVLGNVTGDVDLGVRPAPSLEEAFEVANDSVGTTTSVTEASVSDYFHVVTMENDASDYVSSDSGYVTANVGEAATLLLTYKSGYDNYDIVCSTDTDANAVLGKTHYITYNELEIPSEYTPVKGLTNSVRNLYMKTGYVPNWDDEVVCYASISKSYYTYPCYVFGSRNGEGVKSFVLYARGSDSSRMCYDRCNGQTDICAVESGALVKVTVGKDGCEADFAYKNYSIATDCDTVEENGDSKYEMYLFNSNMAGSISTSFYGTIYKFIVYGGDGVLKHNFVPVKRASDSMFGFYDTVGGYFIEPVNGTLSEASEPTFKGVLTVTDLTEDTTVTLAKNDSARRPITLEADVLVGDSAVDGVVLSDWFRVVEYANEASSVCSLKSEVSTCCNTPIVGEDTRFPITYEWGRDETDILVTTTDDATVEITDAMQLTYGGVPDDYVRVAGLYNSDQSTYFVPLDNSGDGTDAYLVKSTDSVKIWVNVEKAYTRYCFGSGASEGTNACILCCGYDSTYSFRYSRDGRMDGLTGLYGEVVEIDCGPGGITYTNGYDTYERELDGTPTDCVYPMHVFGACIGGESKHSSSFTGVIYKFQIYDDGGMKYDFVPCKRKSDGVLGFYDVVGDRFYLPVSGSVSEALAPRLKGSVIVRGIGADVKVTVTEKEQPEVVMDADALRSTHEVSTATLSDWWHYVTVDNRTEGLVSLTDAVYGGNCYVCLVGSGVTIPVTYNQGHSCSDFVVSEGTLTNNGIVLECVTSDTKIVLMKDDYHDPQSDTDDDLGIFTSTDCGECSQYRVIDGDGTMLYRYSYINSRPSAMTGMDVYEFKLSDIDILSWDTSVAPGVVDTKVVCGDEVSVDTVSNVTVGDRTLYKHTVTLRSQVTLEEGKTYIFKVRDRGDTGKVIAYAKDTTSMNLVNVYDVPREEDGVLSFDWSEADKYVVKGERNIYFEMNGIKV